MNWLTEYVLEARRVEGRKPNKAERRPTEAEFRRSAKGRGKRWTSPSPAKVSR